MISKSIAKFIKSLQLKKYRKQDHLFTVEGEKSVLEVLKSSFEVKYVVCTTDFKERNEPFLNNIEIISATTGQLQSIGSLKSNDAALAVVKMKDFVQEGIHRNEFTLALDGINDPGNLGTIIRIADWYGIHNILASPETADFYSPKVISASKGSFTRVKFNYVNLEEVLSNCEIPVYGAFMKGENIHAVNFSKEGVLVMGNEANGISATIEKLVTKKITIPKFGKAESLNVAMATAVICDNIRRV